MTNGIPTRPLGRTGFDVSVLGFGALEIRGMTRHPERPIEPRGAERVLNLVLDSGINYIDTSIDYGEAEENIGKYISHRREEYFLASKCGCYVGPPEIDSTAGPHVFTRGNIVAGVEQSLKRMETDHLDLVQLHHGPPAAGLKEELVIETLLDLKAEGKVRFLGTSTALPAITDHIDLGVFDVFLIPYSAFDREHEAAISAASATGAGIVIRAHRGRMIAADGTVGELTLSQWWDAAGLDDLTDGMSRMEFMMRFILSNQNVSTRIVGTLNPAHLVENIEFARNGPLQTDIYTEVEQRLAAV